MRSQILEFRLCPNCTALMQASASRCARCKMRPAAATSLYKRRNRLKSALTHLRAHRYSRKDIATGRCPNCCCLLPDDARRCGQCDWMSIDGERDRSAEKRRRLALSLRAALTYERVVFCTHCACNVRTTTNFCSVCQNSFQAGPPLSSVFSHVGRRLRRRWARNAVERATLCPACDIYLPDWSAKCYCCGWRRPASTNMRTALHHIVQSTGQRLRLTVRLAFCRVKAEDFCPSCEVYVPPADAMCMICGWKPARRRSLRKGLRALQTEGVRRAMQARQKKMRLCEHCDLAIKPGDALCMVCGWKPAPGAVERIKTVRIRPRKAAAADGLQRLCPNCRTSVGEEARRCGSCGWERDPARTWARHPRMIWLVPICLALYVTLTATFLQMADPLNKANHIDRYGRTGREGRKQLVSGRSH